MEKAVGTSPTSSVKYPSKISLFLLCSILIVLFAVATLMAVEHIYIITVTMLVLAAFVIHMFLTTTYSITQDAIEVKCGFFYFKSIPTKAITKIAETNNPLSSPATSFDRIEILYNKYDSVIISPKDKKGFIEHIQRINPTVEVRWKKI